MRTPETFTEWVFWAVVVLIAGLILNYMMGCASKQTKYEVRYVKGCSIDMSVATADAANRIIKGVDMEDCELDADIEDHQKEPEQ
jgi:hypothetical protein